MIGFGPSRSGISWKHSFAVRFAVVWAVVLGGAVGVSGWLSYREARHQLLGNLQETVEQDARVVELRLQTWLQTLGEDTRSVSRSPVLGEFLGARGTSGEDRWRTMMEDGFRAVFAGKPTYIQMRLLQIGGEDEGREILRLDRRGERLVVTPGEQLQQKGTRKYFQEALSSPEGEVYFSEINLNRDFGEISQPLLPTIRAAMKIETEAGQEVMLIINADLRLLFQGLHDLASPGTEIYLADEKGDFLMHPREEATFASDLGHGVRYTPGKEFKELSAEREIPEGQWPGRRLHLLVSVQDEVWRPGLEQSRMRGIWTTCVAAISGAGLAVLIAWPFARRLGRLSKALRSFDGKEDPDPGAISDQGKDEIGMAIARFQEMASKVGGHVNDLHRARRDAEEADAAKERFLAVMSHEIRTPMNSVVGLIRALEENDPPARQKPILDSLRASTANLMTLLNTALDYTRLQEGVIRYEAVEFNAAVIGREVFAAMKPLALAKSLSLKLEGPQSLIVCGDAVRLRQVMNNLVNNALKFTDEGEVTMSLRYDGGHLVGEVADSGPGIREGDREKIFEPFFTREAGRNEVAPGAGLGLSVSLDMIEQQGGAIRLECPVEGGAVFTFVLPYPRGAERLRSSQNMKLEQAGWHGEPGILYVEDTPSNQEVMALTLSGTGVRLTCVGTAAEALEKVRESEFDVVMVDLQLPDLSGAELAVEILKDHPRLPIIAVTAQSSAQSDQQLKEAGILEVVLKPYTKEVILEVLEGILAGEKLRSLKAIHPDHPAKVGRLANSMSREFSEAAEQIRRSQDAGDLAEICEAMRHRLTTAIALLKLNELEALFVQVKESASSEHVKNLIAGLERAANGFERKR